MLQLTNQNLRRSLSGKDVYKVLMSGASLDRKSQRVDTKGPRKRQDLQQLTNQSCLIFMRKARVYTIHAQN